MALFKIFKGSESELTAVPRHEGYAYFTQDKGNLYIDISDDTRVQVNAKHAKFLEDSAGNEISVDDLFLADMIAEVDQGGTGQDSLTVNAILIGNGTDPIKMVKVDKGSILVGSDTDGVNELSGIGALYAATSGAPQFGTLPLSAGGTGATTAANARTNLEVYSKSEIDTAVKTKSYNVTLTTASWSNPGSDGKYTQVWNNVNMTCGSPAETVPPIIVCTDVDKTNYNLIDTEATDAVNGKITFKATAKPTADIHLIVIDNK